MDQRHHTAINNMDRTQIQALLEAYGFAVYDKEATEDLREEVRSNVVEGTIAKEDIPD